MGPIGLPELVIILLILLLIFGANRLSCLGKGMGQAIRGFKDEMGNKDDKDEDDKDKDGKLSAEEWQKSSRTRSTFEKKKVKLKLPIDESGFVAAFPARD